MKTIFKTKKEVVRINGKYAARFKKWWQLDWRYIGQSYTHLNLSRNSDYILEENIEDANAKLKIWFPNIEIILIEI